MKANTEPVPEDALNPYAAPAESAAAAGRAPVLVTQLVRATRGARLIASFIDGIFFAVAMVPGLLVGAVLSDRQSGHQVPGAVLWASCGMLSGLFLYGYQSYLVATRGQSLGKRMCQIRIVLENGAPAGFVRGVLLRMWLFVVLGGIPIIKFIGFVDILMIFQAEQRCLHDRVAGTIVIAV